MSLFEQAEEATFSKKYDEAIELYKQSMNTEAEVGPRAARKLFNVYTRLHRYDDAERSLKEIMRVSGDASLAQELGDLYREAGLHYKAQSIYQDILNGDPNNSDAMFGMASTLEATGNLGSATDYFNRVITSGGKYADVAKAHLSRMGKVATGSAIDSDVPVGRWPLSVRPIKVYIQDGTGMSFYKPTMRQQVSNAVRAWDAAGHGVIALSLVDDPKAADITVQFVGKIQNALGFTMPTVRGGTIVSAKIVIAIGTDSRGDLLPPESSATSVLYESRDRMLHEVALHEMGHALGLDHSRLTEDIMANGIFGLASADVPTARDLSSNDIERLSTLYSGASPGDQSQLGTDSGSGSGSGSAGSQVTVGTPVRGVSVMVAPIEHKQGTEVNDAMFALNQGQYDKAMDCLTTVLNRNPKDVKGHYLMAITLVNMRKYKDAAAHYNDVLRLAPGTPLAQRASDGLSKISEHLH